MGCGDQPAVAALLDGARERLWRTEDVRRTNDVRRTKDVRRTEDVRATVQSCGLGEENDWQATEVQANALGGHDFAVMRAVPGGRRPSRTNDVRRTNDVQRQTPPKRQLWGAVQLAVPGRHNVQNALVALVTADWLGIDRDTIVDALATYPGVERRFEVRAPAGGPVGDQAGDPVGAEGLVVIDDYGHHPTEIRATLAAARARYGARPLWAVFQPHTYSRLRTLWDDFCTCFGDADHVIVLDVYGAREKEKLGGSAASDLASVLAAEMAHGDARHISDFYAAAEYIVSNAEQNAVVITLSAGDGNQVGRLVLDQWSA